MIKIGILTYHRSLNYGAVMQASALASEIKKRFPNAEVELVDYMSKRMDRYYKMITLYRGKDSILHLIERIQMYFAFQRGLKELPLSDEKVLTDKNDIVEQWLKDRYDILVIGSDAVWNYSKRGLPNPYFPSKMTGCHYLSFAASCNGLAYPDFDQIPLNEQGLLKSAFKNLDYIGVRDIQTAALVHSVLPNAEVHHNCDPSILLTDLSKANRNNLIKKLERKYHFDSSKPTIAFMMSNHNGIFKKELAKRIKERYGDRYQTVSLYSYNRYADIPYIADLTPQEWSIIFGLFDLTISKYFHGMLFSLLNHTPVIAVGTEKSIAGLPNKLSDMMERMGIIDDYFPSAGDHFADWNTLMYKVDAHLSKNKIPNFEKSIYAERSYAESFFVHLKKTISEIESQQSTEQQFT